MSPYNSIDLTEIVEECDGKYLVYVSPDSAEDSADYDLIAEFATQNEANEFLKNGCK